MYKKKDGTVISTEEFNNYKQQLKNYIISINSEDSSNLVIDYNIPYVGVWWGKREETGLRIDSAIIYYTEILKTVQEFDFTPNYSATRFKYSNILNALKVAKYENMIKEK